MEAWTPPNSQYPPPKTGEPPLHRAARLGDHAEIHRLVVSGSELNAPFDIGLDPGAHKWLATPLMVAAGSGDGATVETIEMLLGAGADATMVVGGNSAASFACEGLGWNYRPGGDAARLSALLAAGSPLPKDADRANRVLCRTASTGDADRLRCLLDHGLNAKGHWDRDRARRRALAFSKRMEEYRSQGPNLLADLAGSMPPAMLADWTASMKRSEEERVERSCSAPSSLEIPLHCAAASGSAECVLLLLSAGADPTARDNSRRSAMYSARSIGVVRTLVNAGVPIEDTDEYGWPPLVDAAQHREHRVARVRALIDAGADVNATHDNGYTVFMSAVGSGRDPEILRMLVDAGADPHAVSEHGYNAFHAAVDVNGADSNAEGSVRSTFSYLKQLGVNMELHTGSGYTPLGLAIAQGTGTTVRVLCELGADPNASCPTMACSAEGCLRVVAPMIFHAADGTGVHSRAKVEALLSAGADPLATDGEGYTPLVRAVAALCRESDDYAGSFKAFYTGLRKVFVPGSVPSERDGFIAGATAAIHPFVEKFAQSIPVPKTCSFDAEWRVQRIGCIAVLAAYEVWHYHRRTQARTVTDGLSGSRGESAPPMET